MATLTRMPDKITHWAIKWKENEKWQSHQRDCTGTLQQRLNSRAGLALPKAIVFYIDFIDEFLPHLPVFQKFLRKLGATSVDVVAWKEEDIPDKRIFAAPDEHNVIRVLFDDIKNNCFNVMVAHLIMRRILFCTKFLLTKEAKTPGYIAKVFQSPEAMASEDPMLQHYTGTLFVSYNEKKENRYKTWTGVFNNTQKMKHADYVVFTDFLKK